MASRDIVHILFVGFEAKKGLNVGCMDQCSTPQDHQLRHSMTSNKKCAECTTLIIGHLHNMSRTEPRSVYSGLYPLHKRIQNLEQSVAESCDFLRFDLRAFDLLLLLQERLEEQESGPKAWEGWEEQNQKPQHSMFAAASRLPQSAVRLCVNTHHVDHRGEDERGSVQLYASR